MFSVVMATYRRGRHILPSIASVLRQDFPGFELLVVGDGSDVVTQAIVEGLASPKVRWLATAEHHGSQTFPNNCGIAAARGQWIAYLGHDDIWSPSHLRELAGAAGSRDAPDIVVSGCIFHTPPGTRMAWVTGLFDADGAQHQHFFPPSSIAHRQDVLVQLGGWRAPWDIAPPVDDDVLLRLAKAGCRFASTGRVTVHKFAAGHRYLSYLEPEAREQEDMLEDPRLDRRGAWQDVLALARANGGYMNPRGTDYSDVAPGAIYARSLQNRGLAHGLTRPLMSREALPQDDGSRALDWHPIEKVPRPFRWSGPNPRPKVLVPFAHDGVARVELGVVEYRGPLSEITARARGEALSVAVCNRADGATLCLNVPLQANGPTVIELETPTMFRPGDDRTDAPRLGLALAEMIVEPV